MADKVYERVVLSDGPPTVSPSNPNTMVITAAGVVYVPSDDGRTWVNSRSLGGGSSDLDAVLAGSSGQDVADALTGANTPSATNVFATMGDVGSGGSSKAFAFFVGG